MLDREKNYVSPHQHYSARCPGSIFPPQRIVPQSAGYLRSKRALPIAARCCGAKARDDVCGAGPRARRHWRCTHGQRADAGRRCHAAAPAGAAPGGAGDAWPAMRRLRARAAVGRAPALLAVSRLQPDPMTARPWRACWPCMWPIGVRAGCARRARRRGAPGAAALPMRAAAAGGAQSRAALVEAAVGAPRNARRALGVCRIQAASNPYAGKSQPIGETRTRYSRKFRVNRAKGDVCCPHLTAKRDQSDRLLGAARR